jgi:hypothetical protein
MNGNTTPRGIALATHALRLWESAHSGITLTEEQRQAFVSRRELSLLVNVSEDSLAWAIRKYKRIDEFVPQALAAELENYRKRVKALVAELNSSRDEMKASAEELRTSLASQKTVSKTTSNQTRVAELRKQLEVCLGRADKYKAEAEDWKKRAEALDPTRRPTTNSGSSPAKRQSGSKAGSTRSSVERSLGPGHRASGWSATTRGPQPQFDDTEPCSQCGARISASAAATHECHF